MDPLELKTIEQAGAPEREPEIHVGEPWPEGIEPAPNAVEEVVSVEPAPVPAIADPDHQSELTAVYNPFHAELATMKGYGELKIADMRDKEGIAKVKAARAHLRDFSGRARDAHKEAKAGILEWGRRVDAGYNAIKDKMGEISGHLTSEAERVQAEQEAERDRKAAEKAAALQARVDEVAALGGTISLSVLGAMSEKAYSAYLKDCREAKEKRDYEAAEAARLKKLQDEAEDAERAQAIKEEEERQKAEAKRIAKERADLDAKAEEVKRQQAANTAAEARLAQERAADAARKEGEEKARRDAEAAAERERVRVAAEAERKAAIERMRPDAEKLQIYLQAVRAVPVPALTSQAGISAGNHIQLKVTALLTDAQYMVERLITMP